MKKHIANIITGGRIIFSLPILFIPFVETTYSITIICIFPTIAVIQEAYFITKGQTILSMIYKF